MMSVKIQRLLLEAVEHHNAGRLVEAEKGYARVRAAAPGSFDALHLSGLLAQQQGRFRDAADRLQRALRIDPTSGLCEMRLGAARLALGEAGAAEKHLRAAAARLPNMPEAWCNLGIALKHNGRLGEAAKAFERALKLRPDFAEAHERLGALRSETEGFAAALPHLRRAAELNPQNPIALANFGAALVQSGAAETALGVFERALALDPANAHALTGRALAWQETYRIDEAVAGYGRVLTQHPRHHPARSARLLALHYMDGLPAKDIFAEHVAFGKAVSSPVARTLPNLPDPHRRLRLGFLSADLRQHAVACFIEPILTWLDRGQFEVFLYHDHPQTDSVSARLGSLAQGWRHVAGLSDDRVEAIIRADAPDVLVDLAGHTGINRLPLFARRLAPVQVTYLGYPDTTGLDAMDFRFVDAITDPPGEADALSTEQLLRFAPTAWSYQPPADAPEPALPTGIEGRPVTFGCFNTFAKVSDSTIHAWSRLLAAVPHSCLLLKAHGLDEPAMAERIRARFAEAGVDGTRIELLGRTREPASHLALYGRVDVALDPFPYHGTTTTCEALWMGCPVVSLQGDRHASRVGASLLAAIGNSEWIARDWDEYVAIATRLAQDGKKRAELRTSLRESLRRSPLLDHAGQAQRFGAGLRKAWAGWCECHAQSAA